MKYLFKLKAIVAVGLILAIPVSAAAKNTEKTIKVPTAGKIKVGEKAPNLASWNLNDEVVTLSRLLQQPGTKAVFVSFYASWCKECRPGLKMLESAQDKLARSAIKVLLVNQRESTETILNFNKQLKLSLPIVTDEFAEISKAYGVNALPRAFLIGKDQTVKAIYIYEGKDFITELLKDAGVN